MPIVQLFMLQQTENNKTHNTVVEAIYDDMASRKYVQIIQSDIAVGDQIGEGEFGIVYKGEWRTSTGKRMDIALKTLKPTASSDERVKLLQEAAVMGQFEHPRIVRMYGIVKHPEVVSSEYRKHDNNHKALI